MNDSLVTVVMDLAKESEAVVRRIRTAGRILENLASSARDTVAGLQELSRSHPDAQLPQSIGTASDDIARLSRELSSQLEGVLEHLPNILHAAEDIIISVQPLLPPELAAQFKPELLREALDRILRGED